MQLGPWRLGVLVASALLAAPVLAQDEGDTRALGVLVRGGINAYSGDLGEVTGTGVVAGVLAETRPLDLVGLEVGYEGSRNPVQGLEGALWRHHLGTLAKVGPLLRDERTRPFLGLGLGLSLLDPTSDAERLYDNDLVAEVPLAVGVDFRFGPVLAGVRATYHFIAGSDLGENVSGNLYDAAFNLGGRF